MTPIVIIPVKSSGAKSRLSAILSPAQRDRLADVLLGAVLSAVRGAGLLPLTFVVTSDDKVMDRATKMGAKTIVEPSDAGVNSAVARGLRKAKGRDALVIPSDLPLLQSSDLKAVLSLRASGLEVVISPSRAFDGTNALLLPVKSGLALRYDDNSFWNHVAGAGSDRVKLGVCTRPGLMFDVDTPEDLHFLASAPGRNIVAGFARSLLS